MSLRHRVAVDFARLANLADGIFAVAMTFLAFSIQLPTPDRTHDGGLLAKLHTVVPQLGALTLTFFIAARYWILHCDMHRMIVHGDRALVYLNLLFLFAVVLLPFSTDLLGTFPLSELNVTIYAGNLAALATLFWTIWLYAVRHPACLSGPEGLVEARIVLRVVATIALLFVAAVAVAQRFPEIALLMLILPPILQSTIGRFAGRMGPV